MKITDVEAIPFAIPYTKALKFASGEVHVAEHLLVRVHTDDGIVGVAEAPPRPFIYGEPRPGIVAVIEQIIAPALTGLTLTEREVARSRMARIVGNPTDDMDPDTRAQLVAREKAYSQQLQHSGSGRRSGGSSVNTRTSRTSTSSPTTNCTR